MTIQEHGVRYRIHFEGGHKTGFFCDQRDNRRDLARFCRDRSVLDVCCYTGGFGLHALVQGQAREVTCVDLDEKAIALASENAQRQPGPADVRPRRRLRLHAADGRQRPDLRRRRARPAQADPRPPRHRAGQAEVLRPERPGDEAGRARAASSLTCSCSGLLPAEDFLILLRAAARQAGRSAQVLAVTGAAPDHPVGLDALEGAYLKAVWLRVHDQTDGFGGEVEAP